MYDSLDKYNNANTWNIFSRVNMEINNAGFDLTFRFESTWAMVVTWYKVPPHYHRYTYKVQNNTYQAILAQDDNNGASFVIFLYEKGGMKWSATNNRNNWIGICAPGNGIIEVMNSPMAGKPSVFRIDEVVGNTGEKGKWIYKLYRETQPNKYERRCIKWAMQETNGNIRSIASSMRWLPKCPCSLFQVLRDRIFLFDWNTFCAITWPVFFSNGVRECCYDRRTFLIYTAEDGKAGSLLVYSPFFQYKLYQMYDREPKDDCCYRSNLCSVFYSLRPASTCTGYRPPWIAWFFGDPHINTLDQLKYTFNGLGEYTLLKSENITMQVRTDLAVNDNGDQVKATVFSAIAIKDLDASRVHVQMNGQRSGLLIFVGDSNETEWFYSDSPPYQSETLFFTKENSSLVASFPTGFSTTITLQFGQIDIVVSAPSSFQNKTLGLLGVYNNDKTDDLTTPNGTILPVNSTEEYIYHNFGELWRIAPNDSILWYAKDDSPFNYTGDTFTPVFKDDVVSNATEDAKNKCSLDGKLNEQCLYDFVSTGSEELAKSTLNTDEVNTETVELVANLPPEVKGPLAINVTTRETVSFDVFGWDENGDNVTMWIRDLPLNASFSNDTANATFTWTPASLEPVVLRFYARDTEGLISPDLVVQINICNCSGNGACDYTDETEDQPEGATTFTVFTCNCSVGWAGDYCEEDFDACAENPCTTGVNCTDLSAEEHQRRGIGYNCSDCPSGFILSSLSDKCEDIDECNTSSRCDQLCVNTPGSSYCDCNHGYRKINETLCRDIDECSEGTSDCEQECINQPGGYNCSCFEGFLLESDRISCKDVPSVCNGTDLHCQHGCKPLNGTAVCFCRSGYELNNKTGCRDIDECTSTNPPHRCDSNAKCNNTVGGYSCLCREGFSLNEDGRTCEACDENHWGYNCENTCTCLEGAKCNKSIGCEACRQGFTGGNCDIDFNECEADPNRCGDGSKCTNTVGSYDCDCAEGTVKKNGKCEACETGYWGHRCLNECRCLDSLCNRTYGCSECAPGYAGPSCVDIDECLYGNGNTTCNRMGAVCVNNLGSFLCTCASGYKRSDGSCSQCQLGLWGSDCSHECHCKGNNNTLCDPTSGCSACSPGWQGGSCDIDIDECTHWNGTTVCNAKNAFCRNTEGSFECRCADNSTAVNTSCPESTTTAPTTNPSTGSPTDTVSLTSRSTPTTTQSTVSSTDKSSTETSSMNTMTTSVLSTVTSVPITSSAATSSQSTLLSTDSSSSTTTNVSPTTVPSTESTTTAPTTNPSTGSPTDTVSLTSSSTAATTHSTISSTDTSSTERSLINTTTASVLSTVTSVPMTSSTTTSNICASNPCQNGGKCIEIGGSWHCECTDNYIGLDCETAKNESNSARRIVGKVSLARTFLSAYKDMQSPESMELKRNITYGLDFIFSAVYPTQYFGVEVISFSEGSVVTEFIILINETYEFNQTDDTYHIESVIRNNTDLLENFGLNVTSAFFVNSSCNSSVLECGSGTCHDLYPGYSCNCDPGFTGLTCQEDFDECSSAPCLNGGTCKDRENSFTCTCPSGYSGSLCQSETLDPWKIATAVLGTVVAFGIFSVLILVIVRRCRRNGRSASLLKIDEPADLLYQPFKIARPKIRHWQPQGSQHGTVNSENITPVEYRQDYNNGDGSASSMPVYGQTVTNWPSYRGISSDDLSASVRHLESYIDRPGESTTMTWE